jgi:hypothetical protein
MNTLSQEFNKPMFVVWVCIVCGLCYIALT